MEIKAPYAKIGGIIHLNGKLLKLTGILSAEGEIASSTEKYYLSSTAGGIIKLDFD